MLSWGAGCRRLDLINPVLLVAVLVVAAAACGGDGDTAATTTTSATGTTTTTVASSTTSTTTRPATPEEEVEAAYLRSWEVLADAMIELSAGRLSEVFADDALRLKQEELRNLQGSGTPVRLDVEHDYTVQLLDADNAVVIDEITNHSVLLDPDTMEPAESDPNTRFTRAYHLRRISGGWRVILIRRL